MENDAALTHNPADLSVRFTNSGTIQVINGNQVGLRAPTTSTGSISVQSGYLYLGGYDASTSNFSGPLTAQPGSTVEINSRGGVIDFTPSSSVTAGNVLFYGGNGTTGTYSIEGSYLASDSTTVTAGATTIRLLGHVTGLGVLSVINGGGTAFSPPTAVPALSATLSSGLLTGNGNLLLSDSGSYIQDMASTLALTLSGTGAGNGYDQINVAGTVTLAGQLHLNLANSFAPYLNEQFTIINNQGANAISGTFDGLPEGSVITLGSNQFSMTYAGGDGNDVVLTAVAAANAPAANAGGPYAMMYAGPLTLSAAGRLSADLLLDH